MTVMENILQDLSLSNDGTIISENVMKCNFMQLKGFGKSILCKKNDGLISSLMKRIYM